MVEKQEGITANGGIKIGSFKRNNLLGRIRRNLGCIKNGKWRRHRKIDDAASRIIKMPFIRCLTCDGDILPVNRRSDPRRSSEVFIQNIHLPESVHHEQKT